MKERFTPGEWVIDGSYSTLHLIKVEHSKNKETHICELDADYTIGAYNQFVKSLTDEQIANAHLIAAAPEMYRMLKSIADATVHNFNYETAKPIYELLDKARGEAS